MAEDAAPWREENTRLKAELDDMAWASRKTNEGIRVLYKDLEKKNAELRTLDQMKSRFLAVVSHELRTPITVVLQAVENIADGAFGPVTEKQKLWLERIEGNATRLGRLVNEILDFSRLQSGVLVMTRAFFDIAALTRATAGNLEGVTRSKRVSLAVSVSEDMPRVWGCSARIEQVLINLLSNAIKFTPSGGAVTVEAWGVGKTIRISVSDTGPGIDRDSIATIFEPFVQIDADPSRHGSDNGVGLGLAICREIVAQHSGKIWAESQPGRGSRFFVELPVDSRAEVPSHG